MLAKIDFRAECKGTVDKKRKDRDMMTLGDKIARERKLQNYTQEQLAQLLDVSRQSVSKWESDAAYPETEKLIRMGKLFGCSMDYLLNEDCTDRSGIRAETPAQPEPHSNGDAVQTKVVQPSFGEKAGRLYDIIFQERICSKTLFGLPLYHIGKNAKGVFALGLRSSGIFSFGLIAKGIFSFGLLSLGIFAFGMVSLALVASGLISLGGLTFGAVSAGIIAFGAVAFGIVAVGAASFGSFAIGAYAVGHYAAIGDYAKGMVALGLSQADGSVLSFIADFNKSALSLDDIATIRHTLDQSVPSIFSVPKYIFEKLFDIIYHLS